MGCEGGNAEGPGVVSPSVGQTYHGYDREICGGRVVGISPGGGGTRSSGLTPHIGVHSETAGEHCGTGGMIPHLWIMYQGRADDRYEPYYQMVLSGSGAWIWIVYGESI